MWPLCYADAHCINTKVLTNPNTNKNSRETITKVWNSKVDYVGILISIYEVPISVTKVNFTATVFTNLLHVTSMLEYFNLFPNAFT